MQRRMVKMAGPSQSPPFPSPTKESISRPSRSLHRVWAIVVIFLASIALTFLFLHPRTEHIQPRVYSGSHLKPVNYLNTSDTLVNPFPFCPVFGSGDKLAAKYGVETLGGTQLFLGHGERVKRVITQALAGQPVTISILGGSVSACHGAGDDPISPQCYPSKFFTWWNTIFPHPASEITNGAMRRGDSAYFGYCSIHHIPDVTDLIVVELDTDDVQNPELATNFETLIRSLLLRPDQPAVLLLGHFSGELYKTYGFTGADHTHTTVANFYDVPHLSTRSLLFGQYSRDANSIKQYYTDDILANSLGHDLLSDVLIAYIQSQICDAWNIVTKTQYKSDAPRNPDTGDTHGLFGGVGMRKGVPEPGQVADREDARAKPDGSASGGPAGLATVKVPSQRLNSLPNGQPYREIEPYCVSANDLINPLPPSLFSGSGWFAQHPSSGTSSLQVKGHYWYSTLPTSKIRIPIALGAGDVGVYYLEESRSAIGEGSTVHCWVDDNYGGAWPIKNAADVGEPTAKLVMIDRSVAKGNHYVECQLQGVEGQSVPMFKILGIFAT